MEYTWTLALHYLMLLGSGSLTLSQDIVQIPPSAGATHGNATYVGCFSKPYGNKQGPFKKIHYFSLDDCIDYCVLSKSRYAGIWMGSLDCYCGDNLTNETPHSDTLCSERCLVGSQVTCGGEYMISVYDIKNVSLKGEEDPVHFLTGNIGSVRLYNSTDLDNPRQLMTLGEGQRAYAVDYHFSKNLIFMSTGEELYKANMFNNDNSSTNSSLGVKMEECSGFAVDWVFDRIYWANCSWTATTINAVDLNGENSTLVGHVGSYKTVKRMEVDPYSGLLFWINDDVIETFTTLGQNFRTNVSLPELSVLSMALDTHNKRLFYVGRQQKKDHKGPLVSVNYDGNDLKTHFYISGVYDVLGLGVLRGSAYWISNYSGYVLYAAPLDIRTGRIRQLKDFYSDNIGKAFVQHMKVVDPELQSPPCSGNNTSCQGQEMKV